MGERECFKMKMFIMNQWLGITEMREDAKMAGRKEHSAGCVFAKEETWIRKDTVQEHNLRGI